MRPRGILARNDPRVRRPKGLEAGVKVPTASPGSDQTSRKAGHMPWPCRLCQQPGVPDQRESLCHNMVMRSRVHIKRFACDAAGDSVLAGPGVAFPRAPPMKAFELREANVLDRTPSPGELEQFDTTCGPTHVCEKNRAAIERAVAG